MAASSGPVILPQFQGDYLDIQRKQALAQALMGMSLQNQGSALNQVGAGMRIMPKMSPLAGLSQLGTALLAAKTGDQANQAMRDMGQQQMNFLMGSPGQPQDQPAPVAQQDAAPGSFGVGAGGGFTDGGVDAGTSTLASALAKARAPQTTGGFLQPGGQNNPAGLPAPMAAQMYLSDPGKYWEIQAQQFKPADVVSQLRASGIDPNSQLGQQIAQQSLAKANYIAPVSLRPGGYMFNPMNGQTQQMPHVPDGFTAVQGGDGKWNIVPVQGGLEAMGRAEAAKAGGQAQFQLKEVWDPTANGGQGGYVQQSVSNVANAANGAPLGIRNNNPGNLRPGGQFAQFPDMETGMRALDQNLQSYAKQGINTLSGVIAKWAPPNENNTAAYIKTAATRLGIDPNQKIDLTNPLVRQAVSTAIALHENGSQGVFGGGGGGGSAPMAAQPPLGASNAANASQGAPSKQMADAQGALSDADSVYQQSREALTGMINLARKQGLDGTALRFMPDGVATRFSPEAAEYGKLHANYVSLQGKALGAAGSDASRATINESVPTYDKPQDAKVSGLTNQLNQLDLMHLKRQVMNPVYQQGNEKAYTQQSAKFDNLVKPSMMPTITPILQLSGDEQRAAVQKTVNANPAMKPIFEMLFNNGMLK